MKKYRIKNISVVQASKVSAVVYAPFGLIYTLMGVLCFLDDKVSNDNSFIKTLLKSKLIISTYPETAFSEAMYSNTPTILIIKSDQWTLQEEAIEILNYLKKNQIAFDNFKEAKNHINKHWNELDIWWKSKDVQGARELFLKKNFRFL